MTPLWCSKCHSHVQSVAWQLHHDLNHPPRVVTEKQLAALANAREVRLAQLVDRKAHAETLTTAWEGRT